MHLYGSFADNSCIESLIFKAVTYRNLWGIQKKEQLERSFLSQ